MSSFYPLRLIVVSYRSRRYLRRRWIGGDYRRCDPCPNPPPYWTRFYPPNLGFPLICWLSIFCSVFFQLLNTPNITYVVLFTFHHTIDFSFRYCFGYFSGGGAGFSCLPSSACSSIYLQFLAENSFFFSCQLLSCAIW